MSFDVQHRNMSYHNFFYLVSTINSIASVQSKCNFNEKMNVRNNLLNFRGVLEEDT